jgi:hypothetical protein
MTAAMEPGARATRLQPMLEAIFDAGHTELAAAGLQLDLLELTWLERRLIHADPPPGLAPWPWLWALILRLWPARRSVIVNVRLTPGVNGPRFAMSIAPAARRGSVPILNSI